MKEAVYSFSNSAGDKFYLRLATDSALFLSKELTSFLKEKYKKIYGMQAAVVLNLMHQEKD